ncbi:hypothetical protein [Verrucosispora sp. NA02020]|uniref:hypothetical protein n=1 Tax=Verrucosispora sp. NA02020 TaxID=2742132 RepID=UPI0015916D52|nr:hypothetical protein [Verrucosispora sp. NA02020]QKW14258.1 hypothetical protein HUT12_16705 [Verrucosispora sp. NA02020]
MIPNQQHREAKTPLKPVYSFNKPKEPVLLHQGEIGGLGATERQGVVRLEFTPEPGLRWSVGPLDDEWFTDPGKVDLSIEKQGRSWTISGAHRVSNDGWIGQCEYVEPEAELDHLLVHWMNLPAILGNAVLTNGRRLWAGRWQGDVEGWRITLDSRSDLTELLKESRSDHLYVLTHVMEIRRVNDEAFSVEAAKALLEQLRVGLSFAFGRWVSPVLPIGYAPDGKVSWESWVSPICDPASKGPGSAWLYYYSTQDFHAYLCSLVQAFACDGEQGILRFQMVSAVQTNSVGFVEQRVLSAFTALENIEWVNLVLGGHVRRRDYRGLTGEDRLRRVLELGAIPFALDGLELPALQEFAARESLSDGPAALVRFRNGLVHPKSPREQIYHVAGLSRDAWFLSRHYLTLLVLHSMGYRGKFCRQMPPFGWFSDTEPVPWA